VAGYHHVEAVMGTVISIDVHDEVAGRPGLREVLDWFHHVDRTFSPYRADSAVTRLGRGELRSEWVDPDVREVLRTCDDLRDRTGGTFDVWAVPAPNGTTFDPCSYVKGWSVEVAAARLEAAGLSRFCLNAGGDVLVRGTPADGPAWRIGIRDPHRGGGVVRVVELGGRGAVATSGTYERGAHLVDPRTGERPADVASATVVGPDLGVADAYSTALFVLGPDGLGWLAGEPGYDGVLVHHDGQVRATAGLGLRSAELGRASTSSPAPPP
jgi:thiamine biosynthesis lipoprotein